MKINVGDYVRTEDGYIARLINYGEHDFVDGKVYNFDSTITVEDLNGFDDYLEKEELKYIIKSSPNIIDLIEVGDYVNGSRVLLIKKDKERDTWTIVLENSKVLIGEHIISFRPIETIVTKEQFEKEMYVLESEVN